MAIKVGDKDLLPYLGDYGPVSIYKGEQKIAGYKWAEKSGQELHFDNTYNSHVEVEVDGQSYQENDEPTPDNPSEIHSLNDFDVVSSVGGRNLLLEQKRASYPPTYQVDTTREIIEDINTPSGWFIRFNDWTATGNASSIYFSGPNLGNYSESLTGKEITISLYARSDVPTNFGGVMLNNEWTRIIESYTSFTSGNKHWYIRDRENQQPTIDITSIKIEKGSTTTPWTPALEDIAPDTNHPLIDKINLSLSEPLRSVGDVKDRLFRDDSDGLWKIERKIGEKTFNNSSGWSHHVFSDTEKDNYETRFVTTIFGKYRQIISDRFIGSLIKNIPINHIRMSSNGYLNFAVEKGMINNLSEWFSQNPFTVLYEEVPSTETLDQELQDQLNTLKSFKGSNYVYTVQNTDNPHKEQLKPTLHAKTEVKDI